MNSSSLHPLVTQPYRVEFTIHDQDELTAAQKLLNEEEIAHLNLTDKPSALSTIDTAKKLANDHPELSMTLHYSIQHHYDGGARRAQNNLRDFLKQSAQIPTASEILLLSGAHPRSFDCLKALDFIRQELSLASTLSLGVAFNPFLQGEDLRLEKDRFYKKLKSGLISTVYFQLGDDLKALEEGLKYIGSFPHSLKVIAAVLVPTENNIKQLRGHGWKGVIYTPEYLQDESIATTSTQKILQILNSYDVTSLWETVSL